MSNIHIYYYVTNNCYVVIYFFSWLPSFLGNRKNAGGDTKDKGSVVGLYGWSVVCLTPAPFATK